MDKEKLDKIKETLECEIRQKEQLLHEIKGYINGLIKSLAWIDILYEDED